MNKPVEPTIQAYGVTREELSKYSLAESKTLYFRLFPALTFIFFLLIHNYTGSWSSAVLYTLLCGWIVGCGISMAIHFLKRYILLSYYNKRYNNLSIRCKKYNEAQGSYSFNNHRYDKWIVKTKEAWWFTLSGYDFEHEVAGLLNKIGYTAKVTRASGDGGIDIVPEKDNKSIAIQYKNHKTACGPAIARELYGAMISFGADTGMIVSSSGFTRGVYEFVEGKPIELLDVPALVKIQLGISY